MEYLLLRQHVSALALGHHQVSNCVSEDTIQCSMHIAHIIQRDLIDNVTIDNCQKKLVYITAYTPRGYDANSHAYWAASY